MISPKVLDVTLRDGGIVNNFNFGEESMKAILNAIEESGVDFIEVGYLEQNTGTIRGRSQFINEKVISKYFLKNKKPGVTYTVMIDYGKFNIDKLGNKEDTGIDAIRFAFHKRNLHDVKTIYEKIIAKGYKVFMQPMVTLHYNNDELEELVDIANSLNIQGIYFVDTFGQMQQPDILRLTNFFDTKLRPDLALGFHSHNNIQMAYANSISFIQYTTNRIKMIDSSIMGMGRGAGNLNTELILSYLNQYYGANYNNIPLLKIMDTVLTKIKSEYPWGYSVEYYLSSINDCSPIYAGHYYKKHMLPVEQINDLLKMVEGEKRISFKKDYAEEIYRNYNSRNYCDDTDTIKVLTNAINGKKICVIAPGKSLIYKEEEVRKVANESDVVFCLNCCVFNPDYILITREEALSFIPKSNATLIITSNVYCSDMNNGYMIDYLKWVSIINDETCDSAGYIILNLLTKLGVSEIGLAGFDGFIANINGNYFDESLKRSVTIDQLDTKNKVFAHFIKTKQHETNIRFITESIYEQINNTKEEKNDKTINLIFDMDGCLIDSTDVQKAAFYGSYKEIVGDNNCPDFSEYIKYTGDSLTNIFRKMGLPTEMAEPYRRISNEAIDKISVNMECIKLIKLYRKNGSKVAICTGKDHYRAEAILKYYGINDCFDALICSDDVSTPKPSSIPILAAIDKMNVSKETCLVIGDGYYDILSAHNAGLPCVLTLWYGDEGVPREAEYTVNSVDSLRQLLISLQSQIIKK